MKKEIWKKCNGFSNYEVSNLGRVRNSLTQYIFEFYTDKNGYKIACLTGDDGKVKHKKVHRLVSEHFLEDYESCLTVNHLDFDKTNNKVDNLEMCSQVQNVLHFKEMGNKNPAKGENHGRSKLTRSQVLCIKKLLSEERSMYSIAKEFKVSSYCIASIRTGRTWSHV